MLYSFNRYGISLTLTLKYRQQLANTKTVAGLTLFNKCTLIILAHDENFIVYDGIALIKNPSFPYAIAENDQQEQRTGMLAMLPHWTTEVQNEMSIIQLLVWINNVIRRQDDVFLHFSSYEIDVDGQYDGYTPTDTPHQLKMVFSV